MHTLFRLKENTFFTKKMLSLRIFPVYNFFVERRSHMQTIFTKNKDFSYAHILYRLSKVHFTYFYSIGNLQPHEDFSNVIRSRGFPDVNFFNHANRLNFMGNRKIGLNEIKLKCLDIHKYWCACKPFQILFSVKFVSRLRKK